MSHPLAVSDSLYLTGSTSIDQVPLLGPATRAPNQRPAETPAAAPKRRRRRRTKNGEPEDSDDEPKRRVVTTACLACKKRKSKCDGSTPACAACSQVYNTPCIYDPNSDHRRKGVYKKDIEKLKTKESTLQTIVHAILNYPEEDVPTLIKQIRTCDNLDDVADRITAEEYGVTKEETDDSNDMVFSNAAIAEDSPGFASRLGSKMSELRLDDGTVRYIGGTSHLLFLNTGGMPLEEDMSTAYLQQQDSPITSWTNVTDDPELITHLLNMYFTWHYSYFTCLSRSLFNRDFLLGRQPEESGRKTDYCSPLLVNAMLALGCHFTAVSGAREDPDDPASAGNHFFREAKRLILENDEHEKPRITTVQALALMSVREAGCGREAKGWVYSGMSFRMLLDQGLHLDSGALAAGRDRALDEGEEDARRITFWGCFLFDKCWSNYLGRLPQLPTSLITCPKFDVFPDEDSTTWVPYTDNGIITAHTQPARTRAVALHTASLCEISGDIMLFFYNPSDHPDTAKQKGKQAELKKLSEIQIRLEAWRKALPLEMEPREGALPSVFIMHMFFQLLFIHLFRPFLQYTASTSPLPPSVSPRRLCTTAAATISRLSRLYKRSYGLRQICNICIYIIHTACTIHLLNLPERDANRDIVHGVKHLEEIAESWPSAARTLAILGTLADRWQVDLPEEAATVLHRCKKTYKPISQHRDSISPGLTHDLHEPPTSFSIESLSDNARTMPFSVQRPMTQSFQGQVAAVPSGSVPWNGQQPSSLPRPPHYQSHSQQRKKPQLAMHQPQALDQHPPVSASELHYPQHTPFSGSSSPVVPQAASQDNVVFDSNHPTVSTVYSSGNRPGTSAVQGHAEDMFGGVQQLLRDVGGGSAGEWMVRDQNALAMGFGNWDLSAGEGENMFAGNSEEWGLSNNSAGAADDYADGATDGDFGSINLGWMR